MLTKTAVVTLVALAWGSAAHAVTFTGYANGSWGAPMGTAAGDVFTVTNNDNNTTANTSNFDFGVGQTGSFSNLFTFNGANSFSTASETLFDIGAFSYRNGSTSSYSEMSSIGLSILLHLSSPTMQDNTFTYNFAIDLTPNTTGDPVKDGDIVSISNGTTATTFVAGGATYTLALKGFSTDGGTTVTTKFLSPEESTARADLYATITTNVPEPSSIMVIAAGLVGLAFVRRRGKAF